MISSTFARSARFGGFLDTLLSTLGELESGLVDPDDLGGTAVDFASSDSDLLTGQILGVDGGEQMPA